MIYILLCLLFLFSLSSNRWIISRTVITIIMFLLFAFWYISDMFTGIGVSDAVYYHLFNSAKGSSLDDLYGKIEAGIVFTSIILLAIIIACIIKIKRINILPLKVTSLVWTTSLIFTLSSSFSSNIYHATNDRFFNKGDASVVQHEYKKLEGALDKKYNYVFIYAESLESTFRNLQDENYLPGLNKIADNYLDFTNIRQPMSRGMGWTMAGLVNTQCGIPLIMEQGNSGGNFLHFLSKADCVATWLQKQGYQTEFIRGSQKEFAGGDKFLEQHGWQSQHDKNYFVEHGLATPEQISGWGIHDDVMLNHAWNEFSRLSQSQQPFLLSFLTVNTHSPSGTFLNACENHVSKNTQYPMLGSVACSDYLLTNFITRVTESQWFDNTIIVLISDHLMMANDATPLLSKISKDRRNHFIIIKKGLTNEKNTTAGTLLDVWPTVLDVSGSTVKEIGFGTSLLENKPGKLISQYSSGHTKDYIAYAEQLWDNPSINDGIKQTNNGIKIGAQEYLLPLYSEIDEHGKLKAILFEAFAANAKKNLTDHGKLFYANICKNIGINEEGICAYIISEHSIRKVRANTQGVASEKTVSGRPVFLSNDVVGVSLAPFYMESGFDLPERSINLEPGFNIINLASNAEKNTNNTLSYPTCTSKSVPVSEITDFLHKNNTPIIFASNDSAFCASTEPLNQLAEILHLSEISNLKFRQQILGIYNSGKSEFLKGIPGLPLDAFIDTRNYHLISLCKGLSDCN